MRILATFGFTENERENYKWIVHTNTIDAILDLICAANQLGVALEETNRVSDRFHSLHSLRTLR